MYRYSFCTSLTTVATFKYYGSGTEPAGACDTTPVGRSGVLNSAAATPVLAGLALAYAPNAVHRIGIAARGGPRYNAVIDVVPAQLPTLQAVKSNQVVTNESCGACHAADTSARGKLEFTGFHGNTRFDVALCSTCHNPGTYDSNASTDAAWAQLDLSTMTHKLHASATGYKAGGRDYTHVTYPQNAPFGGVGANGAFTAKPGVVNCRTCHDNQSPKITQPGGSRQDRLDDAHQPAGLRHLPRQDSQQVNAGLAQGWFGLFALAALPPTITDGAAGSSGRRAVRKGRNKAGTEPP